MQQDNTLPSLETTQTALDQIEELRGKIHLKGMIIKKTLKINSLASFDKKKSNTSRSVKKEIYIFKNFITERDAKACYESAETRKIYYERLIAKLRSENKNKRVQLAKSINVSFSD